jgi:hypothetical protein
MREQCTRGRARSRHGLPPAADAADAPDRGGGRSKKKMDLYAKAPHNMKVGGFSIACAI